MNARQRRKARRAHKRLEWLAAREPAVQDGRVVYVTLADSGPDQAGGGAIVAEEPKR